jgi:hypothetical protein
MGSFYHCCPVNILEKRQLRVIRLSLGITLDVAFKSSIIVQRINNVFWMTLCSDPFEEDLDLPECFINLGNS